MFLLIYPVMKKIYALFFLLLLAMCITVQAQEPEEADRQSSNTSQKVALVIGNSDYLSAPLLNPYNDALAMADALRETGFEVMEYTNMKTFADMKKAIRTFGMAIQNGGVGLFYYAGHGIQVNGRNYLIPTEAEIYAEEEVEYEAVDVGFVMSQMEIARNRMNIIILDACRNNPFARSWRSASSGLAFINAPAGTMIAYATAPGSVASDGSGENGLYTEELLKQIRKEGMKIEDVFKNVRSNVMSRSNSLQTPWESSSLIGDFYFVEAPPAAAATTTVAEPQQDPSVEDETGGYAVSEVEAEWQADSNGYYFFLNNVNIANESVDESCGTDLILYHQASDQTFLMKDYYTLQDNKRRPARKIVSPSNAFWRANETGYWFILKGKNIAPVSTAIWVDDHLMLFHPATSEYFLMKNYNRNIDSKLRAAEKVYTPNGTLWRVIESGYLLYVNGRQIAPRTTNTWSGNDLIVYDEEGQSSFLLKDYYNKQDNKLRATELLAAPGLITWKREGNTYYIYRNNTLSINEANNSYSGNDVLIYEKAKKQTLLLEDWTNSDDGKLREARVLFSPTSSFWRREGDTYSFYQDGLLVDRPLESRWNGKDLELYDKESEQTYILPDYKHLDDNKLRPAILKTGF